MTFCAAPVRWCRLPGPLQLPTDNRGTLLLNDIASLAIPEQIALCDWLARSTANLRLIVGTTANLSSLVEDGRFLEGLFNRINDVQFDLRELAR